MIRARNGEKHGGLEFSNSGKRDREGSELELAMIQNWLDNLSSRAKNSIA